MRFWREPVRFLLVWTFVCLVPVVGLLNSAARPPQTCFECINVASTVVGVLILAIIIVWLSVSALAVWLWRRGDQPSCAQCGRGIGMSSWLGPDVGDPAFPRDLGAAVSTSVLEGRSPAHAVVHLDDGQWEVLAGSEDSAAPGAVRLAHLRHVLEADPTLVELATLPGGRRADRSDHDSGWALGAVEPD